MRLFAGSPGFSSCISFLRFLGSSRGFLSFFRRVELVRRLLSRVKLPSRSRVGGGRLDRGCSRSALSRHVTYSMLDHRDQACVSQGSSLGETKLAVTIL